MTAEEAAWVGALIEGDGCIYWCKDRRRSTGYWGICVGTAEVETVATLLRLTGVGRVHLHIDKRPRYKTVPMPTWFWQVTRQVDTAALAARILPYLADDRKRERAGLAVQGEGPSVN